MVNKKILLFALLAVLALPFLAQAQTLSSMAGAIATEILNVAKFIVVAMWVVAGIMFLMAAGDPSKLNGAKVGLFAAIAGTIVVLLASGALGFVGRSFGLGG